MLDDLQTLAKLEEALARLGHPTPARGDSFTPLSSEETGEIERHAGRPLPEDYRLFAVRYGCSTFSSLVSYETTDHRKIFVSSFYGGGKKDDSCSLLWAVDVYRSRMPTSLIPIAECGEQGEICLGIDGPDYGHVLFWDRRREWAAQEEEYRKQGIAVPLELQYSNLTRLGDSLIEFLLHLTSTDE